MALRTPRPPRRNWNAESVIWALFKLVMGVSWPIAMTLSTPASIAGAVHADTLNVWTLGTLAGGLVSLAGIWLSTSTKLRTALTGFKVELVGLVLLAGGPLQYLGVQVGFFVTAEGLGNRIALALFALGMVLAISARGAGVLRERRRRVAHLIVPDREA